MSNIEKEEIKNLFCGVNHHKIAVVVLCFIIMFASSCADEANQVEGDNVPIYVWPEGPKYYYAFEEKIPLYEADDRVVLGYDKNGTAICTGYE